MKNLLYLFPMLLLLYSCSKEQLTEDTTTTDLSKADIVYHYKGIAYPLMFEEGTQTILEDKHSKAFEEAMQDESQYVTFVIGGHGLAQSEYIFNSEFEGYDYIEKNIDKDIGRKFKLSLRIQQLRDKLLKKYNGTIDYGNLVVYSSIKSQIAAIYEELHVKNEIPRNLDRVIGTRATQMTTARTPILTVAEHNGMNGNQLVVETAANTVIWNYGDYDCYTMAANARLSLETMSGSTSWNDQISSRYLNYISSADAMSVGYFKDSNFALYGCSNRINIHLGSVQYGITGIINFGNIHFYTQFGPFFCPVMDNQISSIRIQAIWQGCPIDWSETYN